MAPRNTASKTIDIAAAKFTASHTPQHSGTSEGGWRTHHGHLARCVPNGANLPEHLCGGELAATAVSMINRLRHNAIGGGDSPCNGSPSEISVSESKSEISVSSVPRGVCRRKNGGRLSRWRRRCGSSNLSPYCGHTRER